MLARLNLPTLQSRRRHLDALYLINVFTNETCCSSIPDTLSVRVPTTFSRHYTVFDALHRAKVSPSTICVTACNLLCSNIDIFDHHNILLKHITNLTLFDF
jgi:hypothetical protein